MARKKQTTPSVLPHLPKGVAIPEVQLDGNQDLMMPGQKSLPSDDWKNNQLVPSSQNNNAVARRSSTQRHGMPLTERHSKYQMDSEQEPPPMFTAQPNKMSIRRAREGQRQKYIYRMDNGIDPVVLLTDRLEVWRNAIKKRIFLS